MNRSITPGEADNIQAVVDGVDFTAAAMERKWGVGRLRLLVGQALREKFDRQARLFNEAVWSYECGSVATQGAAMIRGWQTLDASATDTGQEPLAPVVWEARKPDGSVLAIVRTNAEAHAVAREGRHLEVWTIDEVANLSAASKFVAETKQVFPGALVASVKTDIPDPNDEIPFG